MSIDWFTFLAQVVNFLVLAALLRWLLYDRIVGAMKRRQQGLAKRSEQADRRLREAEENARQYEEKKRQIERQGEELMEDARRQARQQHKRLLKEVKNEVEGKRRQWLEAYRRQRGDLLSDLRLQAGRMGVEAARQTLAQLADADLEKRVCEVFAARMRGLGEDQRREIERYLGDGLAEVTIRSAFDLSDEQRDQLRKAIGETFGAEAKVSFESSEDLICGLELDIGGYSLGWNVKQFLQSLELEFDERLKSAD